jgi:conjugal transfer ATP-binding protein TraC
MKQNIVFNDDQDEAVNSDGAAHSSYVLQGTSTSFPVQEPSYVSPRPTPSTAFTSNDPFFRPESQQPDGGSPVPPSRSDFSHEDSHSARLMGYDVPVPPPMPAPPSVPTPLRVPDPRSMPGPDASEHQQTPAPSPGVPVYGSWSAPTPSAESTVSDRIPNVVSNEDASKGGAAFVAPSPNTFEAPSMSGARSKSQKRLPGGAKLPKFSLPGSGSGSASQDLYDQGVATLRDFIAPPAIRLSPASIQIGDVLARTLFIMAYPKYLGTNWFSPIINMDSPMDISFFIHPIDTREIMRDLRKSATQVQSQISIEAQDGKIRDPVLESALQNIEDLRDSLQQGTEKFFRFGVYMTVYASDEKSLTELSQGIESILEAQLVFSKPSVLRMDQGFVATRPLGMDVLDIANNLNTSPLSTTFPFVSSDLSSNEGILYGINRHNNSLILFDRFKMENANMVVFAKSGAGKSYAIKLEVLRSMMFGTNVIIIDPENEYQHLCETVGGTFLGISLSADAHLNPFDLPKIGKADDDEGVFRSHVANLIGLLHLMLGAVSPDEDSLLDRAIRETYAIRDITELSDFRALSSESFPTMSDLYAVLRNLEGGESLAARLERYTEGVFSGFLNHQTNVVMNKQMVVFNIRDLETELRPIAMYVILQFIWNEIRAEMKQRMIVVDEAWIMMQNEDAAAFMFGIAKRCRKYYAGLTTITQDIGDFMASRYGKPIVTNSSIQLLLRQSPASVDLIAETFYLTDHEKFLLLESNVGEGIFFAGTKHVAIKIIASYSEDQVITTDPRQLLEIEEAKREFDEEQGIAGF